MKYLQSAFCGFLLTVTAAAQTATPTPASPAAPKPATTPQISSLGGDTVKGPEHPLTLDQMKQLFVAMGYEKTLEQNRTAMVAQRKARSPFVPQDVWDDFDASTDKIDYPADLLPVYAKYVSTEDAAKLIDFSKTDAGKHFLENLPELTGATIQTVQQQQRKVVEEIQARHKDELEAARKKYMEENPPKAAPTLGAPTAAPSGSGATTAPAASSGSGAATAPASSGSSSSGKPATPPASTTPQN